MMQYKRTVEHSGPICGTCGVLYVAEGDGQDCAEPGCTGRVSWEATADRLARQLCEATAAISAHRKSWQTANGPDTSKARPRDRALWEATRDA